MGAEGLIATIEDKQELFRKLKETKDKERAIIGKKARDPASLVHFGKGL